MTPSMRATLDALLVKIRERGLDRNPTPYKCKCQDSGLVFVSEEGQGTARPCEKCAPRQYAAWKAGCWSADHRGCDRCRGSAPTRQETYS